MLRTFSDLIKVTVLQGGNIPEDGYVACRIVNSCYRIVFQKKGHFIVLHRQIKINPLPAEMLAFFHFVRYPYQLLNMKRLYSRIYTNIHTCIQRNMNL